MTTSKTVQTVTGVFLGVFFLLPATASGERVVDDFERYKDGTVIGDSYASWPWRRFGTATNDHVVATEQSDRVISGSQSGQYCVYWPNEFGAVRYAFRRPKNLTGYAAASFKVRSCDVIHAGGRGETTYTTVVLAVSNGQTTFESKTAHPVSAQPQSIISYMSDSEMHRVDGSQTLREVLREATEIGMTFRSTKTGSEGLYTETLVFDDLKLIRQQVATGKGAAYLDLD